MRWFSWWRRKAVVAETPAPTARPVYAPGRETVLTGESHYLLPNDLQESNRLDLQHFAMHEQFGTHIFAPIQDPRRILDVASGTGRWARDVAELFPQAQVTGSDVSVPPEIQEKGQPTEYTFVQANALEPLPFSDASFDYVHMRFIFSAMPATTWPKVVRELVRVTAPGGWVELVEAYIPIEGGSALAQIEAWANQMLGSRGIDTTIGRHVGTMLKEAGLISVTQRDGALPMGPYGGRIGQIIGMDMFTAFRAGAPVMSQGLGLDQRQIEAVISQADVDVYSGRYHGILPIYIAWGQRPAT